MAQTKVRQTRTARRPAARKAAAPRSAPAPRLEIPDDAEVTLRLGERSIRLTNLRKEFWSRPLLTKRDLLQYYADVSPWLLPHLRDRAMVMKRYPNGAEAEHFFMKRAPEHRPSWLQLCPIAHSSGNVIDFAVVQDLLALLWVVNLGCIDLNQWYAPCDDVHRPDVLHFDLDPVEGTGFDRVRETALLVRKGLEGVGLSCHAKTTGSRGIHVYVAIRRGPTQKEVWGFAKKFSLALASLNPELITAEYRVAKRPKGRVLVDFNQNAWGRTLASVYSVRPRPRAPVSAPVTWEEVENGVEIEDFRIDNMPQRLREVGDLWAPMLAAARHRHDLEKLL